MLPERVGIYALLMELTSCFYYSLQDPALAILIPISSGSPTPPQGFFRVLSAFK
jgi:hypothetical protein